MKKILEVGLVGLGLLGVWSMKEKAKNINKAAENFEVKTLGEKVLPKARAGVQAIQMGQSEVSLEELNQRIAELDRIIDSSNMIAKLNGADLDKAARGEFYQVIEAKQVLLNEMVKRELATIHK